MSWWSESQVCLFSRSAFLPAGLFRRPLPPPVRELHTSVTIPPLFASQLTYTCATSSLRLPTCHFPSASPISHPYQPLFPFDAYSHSSRSAQLGPLDRSADVCRLVLPLLISWHHLQHTAHLHRQPQILLFPRFLQIRSNLRHVYLLLRWPSTTPSPESAVHATISQPPWSLSTSTPAFGGPELPSAIPRPEGRQRDYHRRTSQRPRIQGEIRSRTVFRFGRRSGVLSEPPDFRRGLWRASLYDLVSY